MADPALRSLLVNYNPQGSFEGNQIDELRYLFLASQVELLTTPDRLADLAFKSVSESLGIGIVTAQGQKCERCWNYATTVGTLASAPTLCHRCEAALGGKF